MLVRHSSCIQEWLSLAMMWLKLMLHAFLTNMGNVVCAWDNMDSVQMLKGMNVHILYCCRLLNRVMNMQLGGLKKQNTMARLLLGINIAAEVYMHAKSQFNAHAMVNLGYMYEHRKGLSCEMR